MEVRHQFSSSALEFVAKYDIEPFFPGVFFQLHVRSHLTTIEEKKPVLFAARTAVEGTVLARHCVKLADATSIPLTITKDCIYTTTNDEVVDCQSKTIWSSEIMQAGNASRDLS